MQKQRQRNFYQRVVQALKPQIISPPHPPPPPPPPLKKGQKRVVQNLKPQIISRLHLPPPPPFLKRDRGIFITDQYKP